MFSFQNFIVGRANKSKGNCAFPDALVPRRPLPLQDCTEEIYIHVSSKLIPKTVLIKYFSTPRILQSEAAKFAQCKRQSA